jgi:hypothetical protein
VVFASCGASISTYTTAQGYPPSKALQSRTYLKGVLDNSRTSGLSTSEEAISSLTGFPAAILLLYSVGSAVAFPHQRCDGCESRPPSFAHSSEVLGLNC